MKPRYLKDNGKVLYLDSRSTDAVKAAQNYLNEHGYTDVYGRKLTENGVYGINTFNAVIKYQLDNGLEADGKIGDKTWNHMWDNAGPKYNGSEHNYYAENEYNIGGMKITESVYNKKPEKKRNTNDSRLDNFMKALGALSKYYGYGINYNNPTYSPDGYVEQVETENALRNREAPVTDVQDPFSMASSAQNYSDTIEWLYQKNRLSK